jgi:hypothetical protein
VASAYSIHIDEEGPDDNIVMKGTTDDGEQKIVVTLSLDNIRDVVVGKYDIDWFTLLAYLYPAVFVDNIDPTPIMKVTILEDGAHYVAFFSLVPYLRVPAHSH